MFLVVHQLEPVVAAAVKATVKVRADELTPAVVSRTLIHIFNTNIYHVVYFINVQILGTFIHTRAPCF